MTKAKGQQSGSGNSNSRVGRDKVEKVKKGPTAYNLYVKDQAKLIKHKMPLITFADMSRAIARTWKELDDNAKQTYKVNALEFKVSR